MDERVSRWVVHGERVVDDTRLARLHVASVELPDGARFEQYVLRWTVPGLVDTWTGCLILQERYDGFDT
jgi:ADP-ribose pyrophosphatase